MAVKGAEYLQDNEAMNFFDPAEAVNLQILMISVA
jgi:hypothetical protein